MAFEMIPVGAVQSAANYLENEWGEDRTMGEGRRSERRWDLYIFECGASDGSRWFIIADRWGDVAHADTAADAPAAFLERHDRAAPRPAPRRGLPTDPGSRIPTLY